MPPFKTTPELRDDSWLERAQTPTYQKWLIGIGTALILTLLLSPSIQSRLKEYKVGDIATKDIRSTQELLAEDVASTHEKRLEAEKAVLSIYDYDPAVLADVENRIQSGLQSMANSSQKYSSRFSLTPRESRIFDKDRLNPSFQEVVLKLVTPFLKRGIVNDKDLLDSNSDKGAVIRNIQTQEERKVLPPNTLMDLKEARDKLRTQAEIISPPLSKDSRAVALRIADALLQPNLTFNKNETAERKTKAKESVTPVYFQVKKGEVILRAGDRVREDHLVKMSALRKVQERSYIFSLLIGMSILTILLLVSLYQFSVKNIRKFTVSQKDLLFLATTLLGIMALLKLYLMVTEVLGEDFFSIPSSSYLYLFPIATGAMIVRIVINSEVAIVFTILSSYFAASLMGNQLFLFIFTLVGSIIGAHKVAQCEQRNIILKAGLFVGGANLLMIFSYNLMYGNPLRAGMLSELIMGFLGGTLASLLVLGIIPVVESVFRYTTDIKLLELANMDHPLIKDLILQAPGTYHHSVLVGSLVEAGAKSVSANPLLARVSAYYHDIGKLKKPLYFIENVGGSENKHDHLAPTMSSLILLSHVKDGLELARENHLGGRIAHIIQQHHGTSLITYFYQKAKEQENPEMGALNEADFRYPGPKPQTKEAGIVMLADAVEAASHTLTEPTPARIKSLVQRIINNIFSDGQLEECELTLKDLHNIEESFTRILTGIFHQRIEYPTPANVESPKKSNHEGLDSKPAKTYLFKPKKNKKDSPENIGRIGTS